MNGDSLMPQILKDEIRNRILNNALESFLEKGFRATSMKYIAQKTGIAVGNIYNYFKDKQTIYDTIARPVIDEINSLFQSPPKIPIISEADKKIQKFINIYKENKKVFLMVFDNDSNTKFEDTKSIVINNFSDAIIKVRNMAHPLAASQKDQTVIKIFVGAYINGIVSILKQDIDEETKLETLHDFLSYMKLALVSKFGFHGKDKHEKNN
jgi:AcrR family transcriptional regulator